MKAFRFATTSSEIDAAVAELWSLGCRGILELSDGSLAYFDHEMELPLEGRWEEVDSTDYVAAYQATLAPIDLGRLLVTPTHCRPTLSAGQRVLWLDPGMAFGSGHHETTRMALEALVALDPFGLEVLDVGSGSGILAIAADLLGAAVSLGIDDDPLTLPVANDNARLNGSQARFTLTGLDEAWPERSADVVVANLYAELHVTLLEHYRRVLRPGGALLITGILATKADEVVAAYPHGLQPVGVRRAGEWTLLEARHVASESPS